MVDFAAAATMAARIAPMPEPTVAVFDVYGTLLDVHAAVARHAAAVGPRAAAVSDMWRRKQLEWSWVLSATGAYEDFWALTERALGYALAAHGIDDAILRAALLDAYRALDAFPDAAPTLTALRARGVATAVLSNGTPAMLEAGLAAAGLAPFFDAVLSVNPLRRYKPHPEVYALVTARFRCQPHAVRFVSANAWDAYAAGRFGFRPAWLNRAGLPVEYWLDETALVIPDLGALVR